MEFNVRFGDPETQVVLVRLKTDLFEVLDAAVDDRLDTVSLEWDPRPAVTVVMAAEGYPGPYERDCVIPNLEAADRMPDVKVFHAGTALRADPAIGREGRVVSDGGRVLDVTALGATLEEAQRARLRSRPCRQVPRRLVSPRHRRPAGAAGEMSGAESRHSCRADDVGQRCGTAPTRVSSRCSLGSTVSGGTVGYFFFLCLVADDGGNVIDLEQALEAVLARRNTSSASRTADRARSAE